MLSDEQFEQIQAVAPDHDLSRWIIVKDYGTEPSNASHIQDVHTNFEIAKRARILPRDVTARNYRGSKIVDLSDVLTYPCPDWPKSEF